MQALSFALVGLLINSVYARFISDNICLAMPNGQKLPITNDCASYIVCEYNVQKIQHCAVGTMFDPFAMVCNWASFVKCGQTPLLPPIFVDPPSTSPTIPTAPTPTRLPSVAPTTSRPITTFPPIPTAPTAPPITASSTKNPIKPPYVPTAPTAAPTTLSTSTIGTIRPTSTIPSTTLAPLFTVPNKNPYPICTSDEFSFIAHTSSCESYYICAYGKLILHSCGRGVYWNTATNQCDFPENKADPNIPIFLRSPSVCSEYYICVNKKPVLQKCVTGTYWNPVELFCDDPKHVPYGIGKCPSDMLFNAIAEICDFPGNVNCGTVPMPPYFEQTITPDITTTAAIDVTTTLAQLNSSCPVVEDPVFPTYLSIPDDCSSYIMCYHSNPLIMKCPTGMVWNKAQLKCDKPENSNCQVYYARFII
ncbi:probable chitinase 10 [Anopheles nili]|uniref:probable chitinase 10 n=1 Tax=Anopheles nili TaxID=185578 RepID=UPI00237AA9CF|nr:probable chitinase 10 [Anopheles nili]